MKKEQNKKLKNPDDWWYKWSVKDAETYKEVFSMEEIGTLFCAVMDYRKNSERKINELPSNIKASYVSHCKAIDRMVEAYDKKCEVNAKNGAKGGKAKAENAKKKKEAENLKEQDEAEPEPENKFEPPKKTVFKDMVKRIAHDEGNHFLKRNLFYSNEFIEDLYTSLKQNNWSFKNEPFQKKAELEVYILNQLFKNDTKEDNDYSNYSNISETVLGISEALLEKRGIEFVDKNGYRYSCNTDELQEHFDTFFEEKGLIGRGLVKKKVLDMLTKIKEEATSTEEPPQTPEQPEPPKQSEEAKQNPYGDF